MRKKYVSDDAICTQEIIEGREVWDITVSAGHMRTVYAAYAFEAGYKLLKEKYLRHFKDMNPSLTGLPPFSKAYADDFAEDLRVERRA